MFTAHKLFFLDACRKKNGKNDLRCNESLFPDWQDGSGRYFAFYPVALGQEASDYNEGSPFSKAITSAIVKDISLSEVVDSTRKEMSKKSKSEYLQPDPQPVLNTLEGEVYLARCQLEGVFANGIHRQP
jgi:hypothetical protein